MKPIYYLLCTTVFLQLGCRSPQAVLQTIRHSEPCFKSTVMVNETVTTIESGSIEEYVQLGLERNPKIREAQQKICAIRHRIPQVLSLPDPMVNTTTHLAPVQTAAGEQAFALGVSQKIVNAERRATQAAIISDEVSAAKAELEQVQLELAEQIRTACYQLLFVRKSIEITSEDENRLAQIVEVIERQYEVKKSVTQQDVLNIQVEQSKIENQVTELRQKELSFQARLSRLLHIDPRSQLTLLDPLQDNSSIFDIDALIAQASVSRPELQGQLASIRGAQKQVHLACLERKPDLTVGLNWIATSTNGISPVANGDDAVLLGIGFNLPVYQSRIRAGICEARANRRAAQSRYESLYDSVTEEIFDLVAKLDSTNETLLLLQEDIIPKSERTLNLSIDEYSIGNVDYVQLIANWRNLLRYRIAEANLQSQLSQLLASLARAVGQLGPISSQMSFSQPTFETTNESPAETESATSLEVEDGSKANTTQNVFQN